MKPIIPKETQATIGILANDYENLVSDLKLAKILKDKTILVLTDSRDGISNYTGYENFRIFCDSLIAKYLEKGI